jgi:hypothetical protein
VLTVLTRAAPAPPPARGRSGGRGAGRGERGDLGESGAKARAFHDSEDVLRKWEWRDDCVLLLLPPPPPLPALYAL